MLKLFADISNKLDGAANSLIVGDLIGVTQSFYSSITLLKVDDYIFKPVPKKKMGRSKLEQSIRFSNVELKFEINDKQKSFGVSVIVELDKSYLCQKFKTFQLELTNKHDKAEARLDLLKSIINNYLKSCPSFGLLDSVLHKIQEAIEETDSDNAKEIMFFNKSDRIKLIDQSSIPDDLIDRLRAEAKDRKHLIYFDEYNNDVGQKTINLTELKQMNLLKSRELDKFSFEVVYNYLDEHDRHHELTLANAVTSFHLFEYNKLQLVMQQTNYDAYEDKKTSGILTKQRYRLTIFKYWLTPLVNFFGQKSKLLQKQFISLENELKQIFTLMKKMRTFSRVINFKINLSDFNLDEEQSHFVTLSFLKEAYVSVDSEVSISFANIQKMLKLMTLRQKMNIIAKLSTKMMTSMAYLHSKRIFFGNMSPAQFFFTFNGKYKIYDSFVDTFAYSLIIFILEKYVRNNKDGSKIIDEPDYTQVIRPDSAIVKSFIETDVYNIGLFIFTLGAGLQLRTLNYSKIKTDINVFEVPVNKFLKEQLDYPQEFCDIVLSCIEREAECRPTVKLLLKHQFILKFINDVEDVPKKSASGNDLFLQNKFKQLNICENRFINEFKRIDTLGKGLLFFDVDDHKILIKFLFLGGFGRVYKVQNKFDQHMYAMKVIDLYEYDPTLIREARNMSRLSHDNVVRYYSSWVEKVDENEPEMDPGDNDSLDEEFDYSTERKSKKDTSSSSNSSAESDEKLKFSEEHHSNDDLEIEFNLDSETEEQASTDAESESENEDWTNSSQSFSSNNKSILLRCGKRDELETG